MASIIDRQLAPVAASLVPAPHMTGIEEVIVNIVDWLRLVVETLGAAMVAVGVALALVQLVRTLGKPRADGFHEVRLILAHYLALALEFQLGADILSTAIAPTWDRIGKLATIAVIRTLLNYFLMREMRTGGPAGGAPARGEGALSGRAEAVRDERAAAPPPGYPAP